MTIITMGGCRSMLRVFIFLCTTLLVVGAADAAQKTPQKQSLDIVVYGGSGNAGQRIVREALNRGHHVTVVVRDPSRMSETHARLKVIKGNVLDAKQVDAVIAGKDVVISAVSFMAEQPYNSDGLRDAAKTLVDAQRSIGAKAPYLIVVGGAGSLQLKPGVLIYDVVPQEMKEGELLGQKKALEYLRTVSDTPWTYLSPAMYFEPGKRTGKYRLGGEQLITNDKGDSRISMEDYAVALLDEAEHPQHVRQRFTIGY